MTLKTARVSLHPDFQIGTVDPRLYGSFIEHLGRAVYGGIYEPGHPTADANGFRGDVADLVRRLNVPIVRYPGGNFVSGYRWEDGVGPRDQRPRQLDPAWRTIETNQIGTNEFMDWCKLVGTEPMMAVNLGTRGLQEARDLLEYCNLEGGTYHSDLRKRHGYSAPHNVRVWCLGNEMDGPWQMGHKTADEYGRLACETGRLMKMIDPKLELVVCGSCAPTLPTFPAWDASVLEHTYDVADYISVHLYLSKVPNWHADWRLRNWNDFQAQILVMEQQLSTIVAACDYVQTKVRSKKKMMLSYDEWNVWWSSWNPELPKFPEWSVAPGQLEDIYSLEDALVMGSMMLCLLRHSDRVRMACLAQLVNVIAPIFTQNGGPAWAQTIYWPYMHGSLYGRGTALRVSVDCPVLESSEMGPLPVLDAAATLDQDAGTLTVFVINRSENDSLPLSMDLRSFTGISHVIEHLVLENEDRLATNTVDSPSRVVPHNRGSARLDAAQLTALLTPASWNVIRLSLRPRS